MDPSLQPALTELVQLLREKDQTIIELSGRVGFMQAEVLQLREQVRRLSVPAESLTSHSAITYTPAPDGLGEQSMAVPTYDTPQPTNGRHTTAQVPLRALWRMLRLRRFSLSSGM